MFACAGPVSADVLPPKVISTTPGGVNIADGSFVYTQTDLTIGPLTLERFHLGGPLDPDVPFFGPHMSHNFDIYVAETHASPSPYHPFNSYGKDYVHMGLSAPGPYIQEFTASPTPVPGSEDAMRGELDWVGGAYVYTDQDGTIYTFTPAVTAVVGPINPPMHTQRVANIVHPNGRTLTFSYNASGQLKEVADSTGYAIIFDYGSTSSTDMNVVAACAFDLAHDYVTPASTCSGAPLKTSYGYTGGLLTSTVDVTGQTTTYSYTNDEISCIKPPGYTACKITNTMGSAAGGTGWQVWQQTMADGAVWQTGVGGTFQRDESYVPSDGDNLATVTDPAGNTTSYTLTGTSPYSMTDPYGNVTQYRYTGGRDFLSDPSTPLSYGSMLTEVDFPEGNKYLAEYNSPYKTITKQTLRAKPPVGGAPAVPDIVDEAYYTCGASNRPVCAEPTWKKDANGNQTDFAYYDWGGVKSEMQPAPKTGAARPLKLYDYVQKYAYIKNSGGTLVAASVPVWLANSETDCQTVAGSSAATCDTAAPITVTTYEYGANGTADNLLLRGKVVSSGGVSLRTCYGYDARSRKIWETSPRGTTTASCS